METPQTTTTTIPMEHLEVAAECLRVLGHPVRLHMVQLILSGNPTVGDLAEACGIASHQASEHLRLMQRCGMLTACREGRRVYYQAAHPCLAGIMDCVRTRFVAPD